MERAARGGTSRGGGGGGAPPPRLAFATVAHYPPPCNPICTFSPTNQPLGRTSAPENPDEHWGETVGRRVGRNRRNGSCGRSSTVGRDEARTPPHRFRDHRAGSRL